MTHHKAAPRDTWRAMQKDINAMNTALSHIEQATTALNGIQGRAAQRSQASAKALRADLLFELRQLEKAADVIAKDILDEGKSAIRRASRRLFGGR